MRPSKSIRTSDLVFWKVCTRLAWHRSCAQPGLEVSTQFPVPVIYNGVKLEAGYRIDLLVENAVVVEIKSVEVLAPVHKAQTLSYLKLSGMTLGLLINFNVVHLKDGIKRFVIGSNWK